MSQNGPILVSRKFIRDFAELANIYSWEGRELEEVKEQTRNSPELKLFWQRLAAAHRAGYVQNRDNNFERLDCWTQKRQVVSKT